MLDHVLPIEENAAFDMVAQPQTTDNGQPIAYADLIGINPTDTPGTRDDVTQLRLVPVTDVFVLTERVITEAVAPLSPASHPALKQR
jgi:hypothetical protein